LLLLLLLLLLLVMRAILWSTALIDSVRSFGLTSSLPSSKSSLFINMQKVSKLVSILVSGT